MFSNVILILFVSKCVYIFYKSEGQTDRGDCALWSLMLKLILLPWWLVFYLELWVTYQQKCTLISGACSFLERRRHLYNKGSFLHYGDVLKTTQMLTIASISRINLKSTKMLLKRTMKKDPSAQSKPPSVVYNCHFRKRSQCPRSSLTCSCRGRESPCARRWRPQGPWPRLWRAVTSYCRHRPVLATRGPPLKSTWSPHLQRISNEIIMRRRERMWSEALQQKVTSTRSCKAHLYSITVPLGFSAAFCSISSCLHLRQKENLKHEEAKRKKCMYSNNEWPWYVNRH